MKFPTQDYYYMQLIIYYDSTGKIGEMETFVEDMVKKDPNKAYNYYVIGYLRQSQKKYADAASQYEIAIEKDPEWADPYAGLASAWWMHATFFKILQQSVTLPKVYQYLNKALELDPESAQAHYVKALVTVWTEFDWVKGEEEFLILLFLLYHIEGGERGGAGRGGN